MSETGHDPQGLDDGPEPLFEGDTGQMPIEARRTFVALLKQRYLSAEDHPKEWRVLLAHQRLLESRFNELFVQLVVDREYQVAYKRQAVPDGGAPFPTILRDISYSREQTILLVHLRELLRSRRSAGEETVFVDRQELVEEVATFRSPAETNHVRDDQAAARAVDSLVKHYNILLETGEEGRYRIAPIIEVLLPVNQVRELTAWLTGQQQDTPATSSEPETSEDLEESA